jgi:hypothetical protein
MSLYKIVTGKPTSIDSKANLLYATVTIYGHGSVEANFGDDLAKPFKYDVHKNVQVWSSREDGKEDMSVNLEINNLIYLVTFFH